MIQAQQDAVTAQIEALQLAPATHMEDAWSGNGTTLAPAAGSPATGSPVTASPATGSPSGYWPAGPGHRAGAPGASRRNLLIGVAAGGVAIAGGAGGWAFSSRSAAGSPAAGTGAVSPPSGQALPVAKSLQQYYGAGARRAAAWKFPTGNAVNANPGAAGSLVYAGSTDGSLYAVSIAAGRKAWSYRTGALTAAPEAVAGVVCAANGAGHFYALRAANGTLAWDLDTGVPAVYKRTWAVDGATVIVVRDDVPPQAYDAATGSKGLTFPTQEPYLLALAAADGVLYALDALGVLYAFRTATGAELWHRPLLSSDDPPGTNLAVDAGRVYLGTVSGTLYALDTANGKVAWTYQPGSGMDSDLAVAGGVLYVKDNNGTLHALRTTTGKPSWTRPASSTGLFGLAVAGGRVYYSTALALQALEAKSGTPVWAFAPPAEAELLSTPAVASGFVFIGCQDDGLYAVPA